VTGVTGPTGATGATGVTGPTGPTGTAGLSTFGYVYNQSIQNVPVGSDVIFDTNGPLVGITHTPGTAQIILPTTGNYSVLFGVTTVPGTGKQFALFLNNILVPGSIYGTANTPQLNGRVIVTVTTAPATLTLRNFTSQNGTVTLNTPVGGTEPTVDASVHIMKLN
jgi:hypothetical protein